MQTSGCRSRGVGGAIALAVLALGGCATVTAPEDLKVPTQLTCFELAAPADYLEDRGPLKVSWETRLERGPYVSEREDAEGVFYRAPPGGVMIVPQSARNPPPNTPVSGVYDGGVWIPRDPAKQPRLYSYFTTVAPTPVVPPPEASCANVQVARNPKTQGVDTIAYTVAGGVGGAVGGAAARGVGATGMSYGKAAGVGAAGGAIGGAVVAALINMDVGKIVLRQPEQNADFVRAIREAAAHAVPLHASAAASAP